VAAEQEPGKYYYNHCETHDNTDHVDGLGNRVPLGGIGVKGCAFDEEVKL